MHVVKTKVRVFVNSASVLGVKTSEEGQYINAEENKKIDVNIDHTIYRVLDFETIQCNNKKKYQFDKCVHNYLEKQSMKNIGCITPFGISKSNICKNDDKAKEAFKL